MRLFQINKTQALVIGIYTLSAVVYEASKAYAASPEVDQTEGL